MFPLVYKPKDRRTKRHFGIRKAGKVWKMLLGLFLHIFCKKERKDLLDSKV
jgi:hypothetical protein